MTLFCEAAWLPGGWSERVAIGLDARGFITTVNSGEPPPAGAEHLRGPVLPGMPNLHSHAFQRAMAGLAEQAADTLNSFWSWREQMYRLVQRVNPDQLEAVAFQLYVEMLEAGYTSVAEFHYLHHALDGHPYNDPAETSRRMLAAAQRAGIGITLLPVLYIHGGFGGQEPGAAQRRFIHDVDGFLKLLQILEGALPESGLSGCAFHSLRAVSVEEIDAILAATGSEQPLHIHVAEQEAEVRECVSWCGQRPVAWLLDRLAVDRHWCLVHATHVTPEETRRIAVSGAVAGLCPTTEANLGDGLFPAAEFLAASGRFGVGSDSQVSVSMVEELRWLEYGQRLMSRRRNRLATVEQPRVADVLFAGALEGGAQALGQPVGRIAPGNRADLLLLNVDLPYLAAGPREHWLGRWLFAGDSTWVSDVMVAGKWVVRNGRHPEHETAAAQMAKTLRCLSA